MKRKDFLQKSAVLGAGLMVPFFRPKNIWARAEKVIKLSVLHTNDTHAQIDPLPASAEPYAGMGGFARRAALVKKIRVENPNTLLLDAGNAMQGSSYYDFYDGSLSYKLMSKLGYDAATIGDDDFANGVDELAEALHSANFPVLCSNYDFGSTPLNDMIKRYVIREFGPLKVGIFGLGIDLEDQVPETRWQGIRMRDTVLVAQGMVRLLRSYKNCDMVICISHLGYKYDDQDRMSDIKLAQQVDDIDLIVGGHTETFMKQPKIIEKKDGSFTVINQAGYRGIMLGQVTFEFDRKRHKILGIVSNNTGIKARKTMENQSG